MNFRKVLPFLPGLVLAANIAGAQPVYMTRDSLELRVAREESVFCGTVSNVSGGFIGRSGGYYGGRTFRAYGPRTKACKVLKAWGVNLPATAASVTSGNQFDKPKSVN